MRTLTFIFLSFSCLVGFAQSYTVYNYSVADGLPSAEVYEAYQDANGFIWFGTDNGVARYDGSFMETFHVKNGLSDPVVFGFFEDSKGRMWFRTFSGKLSYFDNGRIFRYAHDSLLSRFTQHGYIQFVVRATDELVFTAANNHGTIGPTGELAIDSLKEYGLYHITVDSSYLVGLASRDTPIDAVFVDGKRFSVEPTTGVYVNRVYCWTRWKGLNFFNLNDDIFCYDGRQVFKVKATGKPIISLSVDRNDALWVGYLNGGAERFESTDLKTSWQPYFVKDKSVTRVMHDHEGGFWFTTLENGVFHVPNMLLKHYPLITTSRIKGVAQLDTKVMIGDQTGALYSIDKITKEENLVAHYEPSITSLYQANKSRLFVSTNQNIRILDSKYKLVGQSAVSSAIDYSEDERGTLWAYGGNRLRKFRNDKCVFATMGINVPYRAILVDQDRIFLADRTGLHIRDTLLTKVTPLEAFSDFKITSLTSLNRSTMLLGTIGSGFLIVDKETLKYKIYNTQNSFIADNIYDVALDYSDIWLGTEKGLVKIPVTSLEKDSLTFEHLTKKTGLISDKIDFLSLVNRTIWVFSGNNFSVIPLSISKFETRKPIPYTRHIKVNNEVTDSVRLLNLQHHQNDVAISVGFISFNSQNIFLRYRLTKKDPWTYTSDKSLLFSSLSPGDYELALQYSTDRVHWHQAQMIAFNISKPWWYQWYTYVIALMTVGGIAFVYVRHQQSIYDQKNHYLRIINEHQQKLIQSEIVTLERERNRISKELHDRVGTNLTAIKLTVNQILQSHKDPLASEVEEQFQIAIREIKEIIYGLTPPSLERYGLFTSLKNYIGKLNKNIPIEISLKTYGKDVGGSDLNIMLFRVLQELLNNSIKHSFAKNITIHINSFDDVLNILYEDDGIGFSYDPLQSGLGLDSIESRIKSLNGTLRFDSGKFGICYTIDIPIKTLNKEVA
ncbi:MAG TPA: two-component regulator propeller domain-containing protein [Chryseosolibacter sp.]